MRKIGQPDYPPIPQRRTDLLTPSTGDSLISAEIDADIAAHVSAVDPHTQYQLESGMGSYIVGDGVAKITVGDTEPVSPGMGDIWIDIAL
jgi:hypothetical protein